MHPKRIGHVVLKVRDLPQAQAFYTEVLGFEVVSQFDQAPAVFLSLGEQHHDIALFEVSLVAMGPIADQVGLHHVALQLESYEALKDAHAELQRRGVRILRAVDHRTTKSVYFCDPSGNRLELYCDVAANALALARARRVRSPGDFPPLNLE